MQVTMSLFLDIMWRLHMSKFGRRVHDYRDVICHEHEAAVAICCFGYTVEARRSCDECRIGHCRGFGGCNLGMDLVETDFLVSVHSCESHSWPYSVSNLQQDCPFWSKIIGEVTAGSMKTTVVCLYILVCSTATGMSPAGLMSK